MPTRRQETVLLETALPLSQLLWRAETEGKDLATPERRAGLEHTLKEITDRTEGKAVQKKIVIDTDARAALIREARTRLAFFLEQNQRFAAYREQIAEHFNVPADSLPNFGVLNDEQVIEIVVSQFPEAAREVIAGELEAMV